MLNRKEMPTYVSSMWDTVSGTRTLFYSFSILFLLGKPLGFNCGVSFWPDGNLSTWHQFGFGSDLSWDRVTDLKKTNNKPPSSKTLWTNVMAQDFSHHFALSSCVFSRKHQSSQHCSVARCWPLTIISWILVWELAAYIVLRLFLLPEVAQEGHWIHVPVAWWNDETNQISHSPPLPGE